MILAQSKMVIKTKGHKPVFAALRKIRYSNLAYIDESLLQSDIYMNNVFRIFKILLN